MSLRAIILMSMPTPPGGSRHGRVRGVAGRRSDWRLAWKLVAGAAWGILDRVLVPSLSSGGSESIWIGLVVHSTLLVTSVSVGRPIRGIVGRLRRGGPYGAEGIKEPWECSSGPSLITPPNRSFDAGPGVLEPYAWIKYRPPGEKQRGHTVLKSSLNPLVSPDQVRQLNITERLIQDEDHLIDRFARSGQRGLQLREQRDKVSFESAEYMHIKCVLGHSGDRGE